MRDKSHIKELLHKEKFRLTSERAALLDLFSESSSMLTPGQLYEVAQAHDVKIGLTTVYRLLEVLTKVGVATPFLMDGNIYYAYCGGDHHHHFVCLSCHRVLDIHGECPKFAVPENFRVSSHRSDVFGTCSNCDETSSAGQDFNDQANQTIDRADRDIQANRHPGAGARHGAATHPGARPGPDGESDGRNHQESEV